MALLKYSFYFVSFISVANASSVEVRELSKGISLFANDLYLQCVKDNPGNVIMSPFSVNTALALLSQGTSGETFNQLKTALHLNNDKSIVANQYLEHREALEKSIGETTLSIANRIYFKEGYQLVKNFQDVAVSKFKSGAEPLNFANSENSAATINHFVERETKGKIKDLFAKDAFDSDTRAVLVNAIYFKGNWESPFLEEATQKDDFYNSETEKVSVDFMYNDDYFDSAYIEDLRATVLEMKYANSNMTFMIVLPKERGGLSSLERKLKGYDLTKLTENLDSRRYEVHLPKFKIEYEIELNDVLQTLGMTKMFSRSKDFRAMLQTNEQLQVSEVIHKAFIEVNEIGTEAAGATGIKLVAMSLPPEFRANHPFMFFIRDTETNTIIFSGRIKKF